MQADALLGPVAQGLAVQVGDGKRQVAGEVFEEAQFVGIGVVHAAAQQHQVADEGLLAPQRHDHAAGRACGHGLVQPHGCGALWLEGLQVAGAEGVALAQGRVQGVVSL